MPIIDDHGKAVAGEPPRDGGADALGSAGDDSDTV